MAWSQTTMAPLLRRNSAPPHVAIVGQPNLQDTSASSLRTNDTSHEDIDATSKASHSATVKTGISDTPGPVDESSNLDTGADTSSSKDSSTINMTQPDSTTNTDSNPSSDEEDTTFSPPSSVKSSPGTSPRDSPEHSPEHSPKSSRASSIRVHGSQDLSSSSFTKLKRSLSLSSIRLGSFSSNESDTPTITQEAPPKGSSALVSHGSSEDEGVNLTSGDSIEHETTSDISDAATHALYSHSPDGDTTFISYDTAIEASDTLTDDYLDDCFDAPIGGRPESPCSEVEAINDLPFDEKWQLNMNRVHYKDGLSMGSQYVAAYASPVRDGRRVRKSCDSHLDPGKWCVDHEGFINEEGRAGGPFLCSLPLHKWEEVENPRPFGRNRHPYYDMIESWPFIVMLNSTMSKYGITPKSMKVRECYWEFNSWFPKPHVLMFEASRSTVDDLWPEACREIWRYIRDNFDLSNGGDLSVEIFDPKLRGRPSISNDFPEDGGRKHFGPLFMQLREAMDWKDVSSFRVRRFGKSDTEEGELTVEVTVSYRSDRDWRIVREQLVEVLDQNNYPHMAVSIIKMNINRDSWGEEIPWWRPTTET